MNGISPETNSDFSLSPRQAYESKNREASIHAHINRSNKHDEKHMSTKFSLKSCVFGGLDGIVTTFSTISSLSGAGTHISTIIILGFANLVADGLAMGIGDYISEKSEHDFLSKQYRSKLWRYMNCLDLEKKDMTDFYIKKGMSLENAERVVDILSKRKEHFIDLVMVEKLGLMPPDQNENPLLMGLATFLSFLIFGMVPLMPYVISASLKIKVEKRFFDNEFIASIPLTLMTLFVLGAISSKYTTKQWIRTGIWFVLLGGLASALSFVLAYLLVIFIPSFRPSSL
ncbi:uncharacterized protein LOC126322406 [Schistocerca gregaria]|uniref:uncharacterized protein LOC126322406 n=1 Tax=Schistocerca gregaria TaxID=7010 RepID=UPI00211EA605|nr:uncharacterized protein LOC126322406 [Schistocerca gregaria]